MKSETAVKYAPAFSPAEVVARIRAGDESAWRAMTKRYEPLLRWHARQCGLSAEDASDAIQLTWLRCLEHLDQLTDADKLNGWLSTTCRRECIRLATKARREVPLSAPDMASLIDDGREGSDPCTEATIRDECNRLYLAIMALPGRQRTVIVELLRQEDHSYLTISRRLGVPIGSIGPTRKRAFSRLRLDPRIADVPAEMSAGHLEARSALRYAARPRSQGFWLSVNPSGTRTSSRVRSWMDALPRP